MKRIQLISQRIYHKRNSTKHEKQKYLVFFYGPISYFDANVFINDITASDFGYLEYEFTRNNNINEIKKTLDKCKYQEGKGLKLSYIKFCFDNDFGNLNKRPALKHLVDSLYDITIIDKKQFHGILQSTMKDILLYGNSNVYRTFSAAVSNEFPDNKSQCNSLKEYMDIVEESKDELFPKLFNKFLTGKLPSYKTSLDIFKSFISIYMTSKSHRLY